MKSLLLRACAATILLTGLAACPAPGMRSAWNAAPALARDARRTSQAGALASLMSTGRIQHVVIIIQENRSFDNLFQGYPGADTVSVGTDHLGNRIPLKPIPFAVPYDIVHTLGAFMKSYDNGKMDGFDTVPTGGHPGQYYPYPQYGYVPAVERRLYVEMARQYVLADRMFTSNLDGSFVSHQYAIAAQAQDAVNFPSFWWGCDGGTRSKVPTLTPLRSLGPDELACFDYKTLADSLREKGLTWRDYSARADSKGGGNWSMFQAVKHIWHDPTSSRNIVSPETTILQDIPNGLLANVTWVTPNFANSDHSGVDTANGPDWVASVVNAVGESKFWSSTVIFVYWDDWGGWYDHVPPPQLDYDGLGMRVPMLCISPYAGKGVVSHIQYETSSILKFVEGNFHLPTLSASDRRATTAGFGCLTKSSPRPFVPFVANLKQEFFLHQRPSGRPPDDE